MESRPVLPKGVHLDGSYEIRRVLGAGGFGITYEAIDHGLGRLVALKEYYPAEFGIRDSTQSVRPRSEKQRELFDRLKLSFIREARTLSHFNHPGIVRILRVFEAHGTAYMVMDYEAGPTLKTWLAGLGRKPRQDELDQLTEPLLSAVAAIHRAQFLHRDIAPDNIIVRDDGSPVLLDFGATRQVMAALTSNITGLVKMGYSPMEQYAADSKAQGPWTDIYALGATLYRCVSGSEPQEATLRILHDDMIPASVAGDRAYRASFLGAIDAALAIRPEQRPQSIDEFRSLLRAPSPAPSSGTAVDRRVAPEAALVPASRLVSATTPEPSPVPRPGIRVTLRQTVIIIAMTVLLIAGVYGFGRRELGQTADQTRIATPNESKVRLPPVTTSKVGPVTTALPAAPPASAVAAPTAPARVTANQPPPAVPPDAKHSPSVAVGCTGILTRVANEPRCLNPGDTFRDCPDCPDMAVIPAGEFMMGGPEDEPGSVAGERPVHKVAFARPFAASRYEINRKEFEQFIEREQKTVVKGCTNFRGTLPSDAHLEPTWSFEWPGYAQTALHPVVCVSWSEAAEFAASISRLTGRPYRLLSESEWEYAARAGSAGRYFFGTDEALLCDYGNIATIEHPGQLATRPLLSCKDFAARTAVGGIYKPNAFGLYDTIGNVWEWVQDCGESTYAGAPTDGTARSTANCSTRVARGGGWGSGARQARSAARWLGHQPGSRNFLTGFRVARTLE